MKQIIDIIASYLGEDLDNERHLLAGNAFGKRSLFIYRRAQDTPFAVMKIPGNSEGKMQCQKEYNNLLLMDSLHIPETLCPKPLGSLNILGETCFLQEVISSDFCYYMLKANTKMYSKSQFLWITEKLVSIYRATRNEKNVTGKSYSLCFLHGDCWAGNLGRKGDAIVLYDLEFALKQGKPLWDLLHFGLYFQVSSANIGGMSNALVRGNYERENDGRNFTISAETVKRAFIGENRLPKILRKCIVEYVNSCSIDHQDAKDLIKEYFEVDRKGIDHIPDDWISSIVNG